MVVITSNHKIVASGHTWAFNERSRFFALVDPVYVNQANWSPRAWLIDGNQCLGDLKN